MAKFFVQVVLVKELEMIEASDELQAERVAYAALGREQHNAIAMKVSPGDVDIADDNNALTDDNRKNLKCVREKFHPIDTGWCGEEAV